MQANTLDEELRAWDEAHLQGHTLVDQGRLEEAEAHFASLLPPMDTTGVLEFHDVLEERFFFESHAETSSFTRPRLPLLPLLYALCEVQATRGRLAAARQTLDLALQRNPVSAWARLQEVDLLRRQGRVDEALALAGQAHAMCYTMQHFARSYGLFARCLADAQRWEAARAAAEVSLRFEPTPLGHEVLREVRHQVGGGPPGDDGEGVLRELEAAGVPRHPDPRWWRMAAQLAHEHLEQGRPGEAVHYLKLACGLEPDPDMALLAENLERSLHGSQDANPQDPPARGFELVFDGDPPEIRPDDQVAIVNEIRVGDTVFVQRGGPATLELRCLRESPAPPAGTPLYRAVRDQDGGVVFRSQA